MPRSIQPLRPTAGTIESLGSGTAQTRVGTGCLWFIEGHRTAAKHQHVRGARAIAAAPGNATTIARLPPTHGPPRRRPIIRRQTDPKSRVQRSANGRSRDVLRGRPPPGVAIDFLGVASILCSPAAAAAAVATASWWNASLPLMFTRASSLLSFKITSL